MTETGIFRQEWDEKGAAPRRPRASSRIALPSQQTNGSKVHRMPAVQPSGVQWGGWPLADPDDEQHDAATDRPRETAPAASPAAPAQAPPVPAQGPPPAPPAVEHRQSAEDRPTVTDTAANQHRHTSGAAPDVSQQAYTADGVTPGGEWRPASVDLSHDTLSRHRGDVPRRGWRRAVYVGSGGLINPGIGDDERARQVMRARVQRPLYQSRRIAVISVKGGIGKTTTTACLGMALAEVRGDQVSVMDANPDAGTLADRLTGNTSVTIRHLLRNIDGIGTLTEISSYMSLAGRLKVLASDQDPAVSDALTADEYERAIQLMCQFFNLVITDSGTGISHPTMGPTLRLADSLVVVGSPTIDGASRAGHTLDWLESHGYGTKARNAIVVLSGDRSSQDVDASRIANHFATRVRAVVDVPFDPHLAAGGRIEFERLRVTTRDAYTAIAAHIADQFPDRQD